MTYQSYFKILNPKQQAKILAKLKEQFGIKEINGQIIQRGEERLFLYQGNLTTKEIQELERTLPVERIGIYFAKLVPGEDKIRLSIDGANLFKDQITKNIFELTDKQADEWLHGNEILIDRKEESEDETSKGVCELIDKRANVVSEVPGGEGGTRTNSRTKKIPRDFVIIKHHEDFLGTGKASAEKITNFVPKNRRLKERN